MIKAENIEATEEDIQEEINKMKEAYNMDDETIAKYVNDEFKANISADIAAQKAVEFVADAAVEVEAKAEETTEE